MLKAAPSSQRTKVPLPSVSLLLPHLLPLLLRSCLRIQEDEPLFMKPADLQQEGTRFPN